MQTPITITIESARFSKTTLSVIRNALLYLLPLTMGAVETRPSRKMPIRSLGVFSQSTSFFTSSNHGLRRKGERKQKKGRAKNRSAILGLIIF